MTEKQYNKMKKKWFEDYKMFLNEMSVFFLKYKIDKEEFAHFLEMASKCDMDLFKLIYTANSNNFQTIEEFNNEYDKHFGYIDEITDQLSQIEL